MSKDWRAKAREADMADLADARRLVQADPSPENRQRYTNACKWVGVIPEYEWRWDSYGVDHGRDPSKR